MDNKDRATASQQKIATAAIEVVVSVTGAVLLSYMTYNYRSLSVLFSFSDRQSCKHFAYLPAAGAH